MDSISQIALGAATGEIAAGNKAGNKALLWGAVAGTIPDLDVLAAPFLDPISNLIFHRGFTHSFWFAFLMAPILGYILNKAYAKRAPEVKWKDWTFLFFLALFTHPLLDCFTTWGTQFFFPFSHYRVAFNTIFVVDPFYTLPFVFCLAISAFLRRNSNKRKYWNWTGLVISCAYLAFTVFNKFNIDHYFEKAMQAQKIETEYFMSAPTPLNNFLWYATASSKDSLWIGYQSVFDKDRDAIRFISYARNLHLGKYLEGERPYEVLKNVSKDFYILRKASDGIYFYDMRFGLMDGWEAQSDSIQIPFYWHIPAEKMQDGMYNVSRKRSNNDIDSALWNAFIHRIQGNKF